MNKLGKALVVIATIGIGVMMVIVIGGTALPVRAIAQSGEIPSFDEFLRMVGGPMLGTIMSVGLSYVIEFMPQYQSLHEKVKTLVYIGGCVVIAVAVACIRAGMGYVAWSWDPLMWHAIWNGFAQAGLGNFAHKFLPKWETRQLVRLGNDSYIFFKK